MTPTPTNMSDVILSLYWDDLVALDRYEHSVSGLLSRVANMTDALYDLYLTFATAWLR